MKMQPKCPIIAMKPYLDGRCTDQSSVDDLTRQVTDAFDNFGAFFVVDHNIDRELCRKVFVDFRQFFDLPIEEKRLYQLSNKSYRGYEPFESTNCNAFMGKFGYPNDAVERFRFGPPEMLHNYYFDDAETNKAIDDDYKLGWAPNLYHNCFKEDFQIFYKEMSKLAFKIMEVLSMAMGQPPDYLPKLCAEGAHVGSVAHYPSGLPKSNKQDRTAPHTDLSVITVIMQDDTKDALKVLNTDGEWCFVNPPASHSVVVLLGECMPYLTNGHWPGTLHYVTFPVDRTATAKDRLSTQLFVFLPENTLMHPAPKFLDENGRSSTELLTYKELSKRRMKYLMPS